MTDLMELASRVEAGEASFALDTEIAYAINHPLEGLAKPYTASLDAAMSLVPEEAFWKIENHPMYGFCGTVDDEQAFACTGPLTLAAAALRAIACRGESHVEQ